MIWEHSYSPKVSILSQITGSSDFFGLNFYSGGNVQDNPDKSAPWNPANKPSIDDDKGVKGAPLDPSWKP